MFNSKGQTLIELVIVVAVIVLVVGALVFATISSIRNATLAKNQSQATKLAQEGLEKVRSLRNRNEDGKVDYLNGNTHIYKFSELLRSDSEAISFNCSSNCYFRFSSDRLIGVGPTVFEDISPFQRQIWIEDEVAANSGQKRVTSYVKWTDFAGEHESRLTTILRQL